jgi:GT2 family glycosyltransferase
VGFRGRPGEHPLPVVVSDAPIVVPSSDSPRVSVIIPSGAPIEFLLACLRSLARQPPSAIPFETIVLRNGATAESMSLLDRVRGVRIEPTAVNLGLAGAGNRGRSLARGELLILLHDDAEIEPGWMEGLVATAEAHPEAGAIGGKVLDMGGTLQNAGMVLWRDGSTAPPWIDRPDATAFAQLRAVDYCGTSSLLVRAATWDAVGGLDELFYPVYYVDVDLAMAIRSLGQVVLYQPASQIRHHRGASGDERWRFFLTARNRERLVGKWRRQLDEQHEPKGDGAADALHRAMARAEAVQATTRSRKQPVPHREPRAIVAADHDRLHIQLAIEVQKAYAQDLAAHLDGMGPVRWWGLYERIQALVRFLRRLRF